MLCLQKAFASKQTLPLRPFLCEEIIPLLQIHQDLKSDPVSVLIQFRYNTCRFKLLVAVRDL